MKNWYLLTKFNKTCETIRFYRANTFIELHMYIPLFHCEKLIINYKKRSSTHFCRWIELISKSILEIFQLNGFEKLMRIQRDYCGLIDKRINPMMHNKQFSSMLQFYLNKKTRVGNPDEKIRIYWFNQFGSKFNWWCNWIKTSRGVKFIIFIMKCCFFMNRNFDYLLMISKTKASWTFDKPQIFTSFVVYKLISTWISAAQPLPVHIFRLWTSFLPEFTPVKRVFIEWCVLLPGVFIVCKSNISASC